MDWETLARNLKVGGKTRVDCECGSGKTQIINHYAKTYSRHCFRCDLNDYIYKGKQSLIELARIDELNDVAKVPLRIELPDDFTYDIPLHGRLWLYKGGLTETTWVKHRIGYSPYLDRVILPVYKDDKLIWFQCRALHKGQKPKYIQPSAERESIMFRVGYSCSDSVVIVEDILSAIRVGKHISTVSLLGTKITTAQASILSDFKNAVLWLDNDRAGKQGSYNIRKTLSLIMPVFNISTSCDPKELDNQQILKELQCFMHSYIKEM